MIIGTCNICGEHEITSYDGAGCVNLSCPKCVLSIGNRIRSVMGLPNEYPKEELNRREKDMNEQPKLQVGMMVQLQERGENKNNWTMIMFDRFDNTQQLMYSDGQTIGIGAIENAFRICVFKNNGFHPFFRNDISNDDIEILWSRKSDKDIKIEELQKKMDEISREMESLKG